MGGSGFEFASRLGSQQAGADRDANNSLKVAAQAQDRALQSIMQSGQLATQYRNQDFDEQAKRAAAADAINRFNTTNMQDVQSRNLASQNRAAEMNLAERQKISDQNVNLANQEQKYNKDLLQQKFENEAKVAAGKSGQYAGQAQSEMQKGQALGNMFTNFGQAASGAAAAQANQDFWDKYLKTRTEPPAG
jgi:hypothetical protein